MHTPAATAQGEPNILQRAHHKQLTLDLRSVFSLPELLECQDSGYRLCGTSPYFSSRLTALDAAVQPLISFLESADLHVPLASIVGQVFV